MMWESATEFWAMGGYGLYVWGSYGAAVLCMAAEPLMAARRRRAALRAAREAASRSVQEEDDA